MLDLLPLEVKDSCLIDGFYSHCTVQCKLSSVFILCFGMFSNAFIPNIQRSQQFSDLLPSCLYWRPKILAWLMDLCAMLIFQFWQGSSYPIFTYSEIFLGPCKMLSILFMKHRNHHLSCIIYDQRKKLALKVQTPSTKFLVGCLLPAWNWSPELNYVSTRSLQSRRNIWRQNISFTKCLFDFGALCFWHPGI